MSSRHVNACLVTPSRFDRVGLVNPSLVTNLAVEPPSLGLVDTVLREAAVFYRVDWAPAEKVRLIFWGCLNISLVSSKKL